MGGQPLCLLLYGVLRKFSSTPVPTQETFRLQTRYSAGLSVLFSLHHLMLLQVQHLEILTGLPLDFKSGFLTINLFFFFYLLSYKLSSLNAWFLIPSNKYPLLPGPNRSFNLVLNEQKAIKWETNLYIFFSSSKKRTSLLFFDKDSLFDQTLTRILNLFIGPSVHFLDYQVNLTSISPPLMWSPNLSNDQVAYPPSSLRRYLITRVPFI